MRLPVDSRLWQQSGAGACAELRELITAGNRATELPVRREMMVTPIQQLLHKPEPFPTLRDLRQFPQFSLRQLAVGDDGAEMVAHLAHDVDGKK